MSLRTRILLLSAIVAAAVLAMAGMVYLTIRDIDFYRQRVALAHQQLAAMVELAQSAGRYSEEFAEILLLGEQERPDFMGARYDVEAGFANLEEVTRSEIAFLRARPPAEVAEEARELERIDSHRRLYREIDRAVEHVFELSASGRHKKALALFSTNVKRRLDDEFKRLLAEDVQGEREEVAAAEAAAVALSRRLTVALAVTAVLSLSISLGAAFLLSRSLSGSIDRLMAGAAAFGRGNLGHRIPAAGADELSVLSHRFNEMAHQLEDQQHHLMLAKSELETQVRERTLELQRANARLQHLDQSRVRFLADISHELRTPLTIVRGEAEVSLRGAAQSEEDYRDTLEQIVQEVAQMSRLVEDLLFLARSESGAIGFETRPIVLQEILGEVLEAGEALTTQSRVTLDGKWPEDPILVRADPQRLKQAMVILIDNAIKYSDSGDVVRIGAELDGRFAAISVIDHGPGISSDDLPYVFERFYRGGTGRSRDLGGSGLGLPIAKWIAEKHGGAISVTSAPRRQTEFKIRLPLEG